MSRDLIPVLWDDLHRTEDGQMVTATNSIQFAEGDGQWFEVDLTDDHAKAWREFLDRHRAAATPCDPPAKRSSSPGRHQTATGEIKYGTRTGHNITWNKALRAWADTCGLRVDADGNRLPDHSAGGFPAYASAGTRRGERAGTGGYYYPLWLVTLYTEHLASARAAAADQAAAAAAGG